MEIKPAMTFQSAPDTYPNHRCSSIKLSRAVTRMKMDYITKFGPLNFTASKTIKPDPRSDSYYLQILEKQISLPYTVTPRSKSDHQFRKLEDELFCLKTPALMTSSDGSKTLRFTFAEEKKDRPFLCHICPKSFMAQRTLNLHLQLHEHEEEQDVSMSDSSASDSSPPSSPDLSSSHSPTPHHSSRSSPRYHCDTCNKNFMQKSNLERHQLIHYRIQKYACDQCDRTFTQKAGLTRHLASHSGVKEFSCLECGKQFTRRSTLYTHLLTRHLGEKPFHCDQCDMYFTSAANYRTHTRRVHSTESLKHVCEVCSKKFFQKSDLTRHLRIHTGEKPYACNICHKAWTQSNGLKLHLKKVHDR